MVSHNRLRITALTVVGIALLIVSAALLGSHYLGYGRVGRVLSSAPLPPGLGPSVTASPSTTGAPKSAAAAPAQLPGLVANKPGIPVSLVVSGHRVQALVSAHRLNADGSLFVPADPRAVSWSSQDVGPGGSYGTTILVGHVNFGGVAGVFSDLADYRVGQVITVVVADGRRLRYVVAAPPIEVNKGQVGSRRAELFDQSQSYGLVGGSKSGRLLLLSCGGVFDNRTGHYESNIFVYALPT